MPSVLDRAKHVCTHLNSLAGFKIARPVPPADHMGAVIAESVLQAAFNYENGVRPRVDRILGQYAGSRSSSEALALVEEFGALALLGVNNKRKLGAFEALLKLLVQEGVESLAGLRTWLNSGSPEVRLTSIHGVGDKTVDYLRILAGLPGIALDVHLKRLLAEAGVEIAGYEDGRTVLEAAADQMRVDRTTFDFSLWRYMSSRGGKGTPKARNSRGKVAPGKKRTRGQIH